MQEIKCLIVREKIEKNPMLNSAMIAKKFDYLKNKVQENLIIVSLNTKNYIIGKKLVALGSQNACHVTPSDIIRPVILSGGISCILVHNHPSGESEPSPDDISFTKAFKKACEILKIKLLDHIIIGDGYYSFTDNNLI